MQMSFNYILEQDVVTSFFHEARTMINKTDAIFTMVLSAACNGKSRACIIIIV